MKPFNGAAWMPHSQEGLMQPKQPPKQQDKTAAPNPDQQDLEQQYGFGLWKVFRALGLSVLITAVIFLIIQFVFGIKVF
ncbi:MAG: hypothetical protein HY922_10750 [Elusimicrobia bacterium]|nr:hypothetical protein [Elusimicrobiota bacterium]